MLGVYIYTSTPFDVSSDFGEIRSYGIHAGIDYISTLYKQQEIKNILAGTKKYAGYDRDAGYFIVLKHNLKYIGGIDDYFYTIYKHLHLISKFVINKAEGSFIPPDIKLGIMGNTGYSKTRDITGWRFLTEKEKKDDKCKKGVHLHLQISQIAEKGQITSLLRALIENNFIEKENRKHYFYRNGRVYIHPLKVLEYVRYLEDRKLCQK